MKKCSIGKVSLEERRRFLKLGLQITGVLAGGTMLSLLPAKKAASELLLGPMPMNPIMQCSSIRTGV